MRRSVTVAAALVAWVAAPAAAGAMPPEAGRHSAQLCVATLPKPLNCGPAQVEMRADGSMRVRVDDIVYTLRLRSSQLDVLVMHNVVQIDAFSAVYEWAGRALTFQDDDRRSRYELRFEAGSKAAAR